MMRIVSRPAGGAPPEIRDRWIGLVMPVYHKYEGPLGDVMSGKKTNRRDGYAVKWEDAMQALGEKHPEAADWWEANVGRTLLIFSAECCEILPD